MLYDLPMNYSKSHQHSSFCSSSPSPSTKNADISRLLDPSYASTSSSASCSYPTAYVDHDGEVHDPDYRHFPSPTPSRRRQQRQREQRRWGYDEIDEEDMDEEYMDDEDLYYSHRRSSSLPRHSHRRHQQTRALSPLLIPLPPLSTSPSSINTVESWLSGGERDDVFQTDASHFTPPSDHSGTLRKKRCKKSALFSSPSHSPSYLPSMFSSSVPSLSECPDFEGDESRPVPEVHVRPASPLSGEALKKEWHAISLSVSIGVFRMKRRMKEVIARA